MHWQICVQFNYYLMVFRCPLSERTVKSQKVNADPVVWAAILVRK